MMGGMAGLMPAMGGGGGAPGGGGGGMKMPNMIGDILNNAKNIQMKRAPLPSFNGSGGGQSAPMAPVPSEPMGRRAGAPEEALGGGLGALAKKMLSSRKAEEEPGEDMRNY